jgi:HK97 family phage prohead protease
VAAFTKAINVAAREVEQVVSVFELVDLVQDRVKAGAFAGSLDRWAASGDPIPVIWSHAWLDPYAHIGFVLEAKELLAGDPLLPPAIVELGGLYCRYKLDDKPFAEQVFKLLEARRVREASFAYDVLREKRNSDGTTDLLELDLIEVGPTLKGANPATQLLAAKSLRHRWAPRDALRAIDAMAADAKRYERSRSVTPSAALAEIHCLEV